MFDIDKSINKIMGKKKKHSNMFPNMGQNNMFPSIDMYSRNGMIKDFVDFRKPKKIDAPPQFDEQSQFDADRLQVSQREARYPRDPNLFLQLKREMIVAVRNNDKSRALDILDFAQKQLYNGTISIPEYTGLTSEYINSPLKSYGGNDEFENYAWYAHGRYERPTVTEKKLANVRRKQERYKKSKGFYMDAE